VCFFFFLNQPVYISYRSIGFSTSHFPDKTKPRRANGQKHQTLVKLENSKKPKPKTQNPLQNTKMSRRGTKRRASALSTRSKSRLIKSKNTSDNDEFGSDFFDKCVKRACKEKLDSAALDAILGVEQECVSEHDLLDIPLTKIDARVLDSLIDETSLSSTDMKYEYDIKYVVKKPCF
jgi:hypothetical protein